MQRPVIKDCGNHHNSDEKLIRCLLLMLAAFVTVVGIVIFIIWLVLQPHKPRFVLLDVTVYQFNLTAPYFLTTFLQVTLASQNQNRRIGIVYERLRIFATYRNQQVTFASPMPEPMYERHRSMDVWSPKIAAGSVPISSSQADLITEDLNLGHFLLEIKAIGRLRWRVGTWKSGRYHIHVICQANVWGNPPPGIGGTIIAQMPQPVRCRVNV